MLIFRSQDTNSITQLMDHARNHISTHRGTHGRLGCKIEGTQAYEGQITMGSSSSSSLQTIMTSSMAG